MFHLIGMIVFGAIIGFIAKLILPGNSPGGFWMTSALGIAGSLVGGLIGRMLGFHEGRLAAGWLMSIVGALIVLAVYHSIVRGRSA